MRSILWVAVLAMLPPLAAQAAIGDAGLCADAIREVEAGASLPAGLLTAVAVSESGKYDADRRRAAPWPWTVNSQGDGRYFATAAEAIAHVDALRRSGRRNIDVGCMQINLMHHPDAFASLEEAFEPTRNVAYGARFLGQLRDETRSWTRAVERYHTADIDRGRAYREKVYERWQAVRPDPGQGLEPEPTARVESASLAAATPPAVLRTVPDRRRLVPLRSRGFISLTKAPSGVAILRPSPPSQLKPIIRLPARATTGLVRLMPLRRNVAALPP